MNNESVLWTGLDATKRSWFITYRPEDGQLTVRFICWRASGAGKALDQTCAWGKEGWDISRPWLPRSPAPVPVAVLRTVERQLKQLVQQQQQAQVQQEGVGRG